MAGPPQAMGSALPSRAAWLALSTLLGCGPPPPPEPPPAVAAAAELPPPQEFAGAAWTSLLIASVPARITLPDAGAWHASRAGSFVLFEHRPSASTIALRVWRAARLVRPSECEAEARFLRPGLPAVAPASRIDERRLTAPADFDVRLVVGAEPGPGTSVRGSVLAVGAGIGRCYLASYETHADGAHAAERVADRLDALVRGFFETVELESADRRIPPPPTGVK
ncbi:MAG TPA: hypothetical protein VGK73_02525 [Polyangiaceae bacterium]